MSRTDLRLGEFRGGEIECLRVGSLLPCEAMRFAIAVIALSGSDLATFCAVIRLTAMTAAG